MNINTIPILKTERLILKQISTEDAQAIFDLRSDPEINEFLDRKLCETTEEAKSFINIINENIKKSTTYYWSIFFTNTELLVGTICLFNICNKKKECEIGFELLMKYHKQGIMQECLLEVFKFVFQTLKYKKIIAITHSENQNSIKLLLKFNFKKSKDKVYENNHLSIYTLKNIFDN